MNASHIISHRVLRFILMIGALLVGLAGRASADWNDPVMNTPSLVQIDFGPYGDQLPGDGQEYCEPTSLTMNLYWMASNGFTQLAPTSYNPSSPADVAAANNLDLVIAGLAGTTATGGSVSGSANTAMSIYFAAEGISTSQYTYTSWDPSGPQNVLQWMDNNMTSNQATNSGSLTMQIFSVGWYKDTGTGTWTNSGGHVLDPLSISGTMVTLNNPYPGTFLDVPNVPASNPETVGVSQVPSGITLEGLSDPSQDYSQIQSVKLGDGTDAKAVIRGTSAWSIDASALTGTAGYTINPWTLTPTGFSFYQYINTNGGTFTVIAPLLGSTGFQKTGNGTMLLTGANSVTGANLITGGTLASTATSGTPFGTGSVTVENDSVLEVEPMGTTSMAVNLQIASGAGSLFVVESGGGTLQLVQGSNTSLTVTLGGQTDGTTPNLILNDSSTLIIALDQGLTALGGSTQVLVAGTGGNLPTMTAGMVSPNVVGQNNDANLSGAFLTYSGTNGFMQAATVLSSTNGINSGTLDSSTIYEVNDAQSITGGNTVSVHALEIDGTTLGESQPGSTIKVGEQLVGSLGGVIFNGGEIATSNLDFGAGTGTIYTSLANGTISSQINGTGGLTTFGPGALTISSNNTSTLSGTVNVNKGTLIAASAGGSATGSGPVIVQGNATLQINAGASVSGTITVNNNGTLHLNGGTAGNAVNIAAPGSDTSEPGGTLQGQGTIAGVATIGGAIKADTGAAGTIEFQQAATLVGSSFYWQLNTLADNSTPGSGAGINWNSLQFDMSGLTQLGSSATNGGFTVYLDFSQVQGPETADSFWDTTHSWNILTFDSTPDWSNYVIAIGNGRYQDVGQFTGSGVGDVYTLTFNPVPEPGTWALCGCGLVVLVLCHRGRGRKRA